MGMALAVLLRPCLADTAEGSPDGQEVQRDALLRAGRRRPIGECASRLVPLDPGLPRHPL